MAYQLYRNTTLGNSLQESLDELIQSQQITPQLALQVLLQFDKAINSALAQRVRNRVNFRSSLFKEKHRRDFIYSSIAEMTTLCYTIRESSSKMLVTL
ncbi:Transcription initiation factor IIA subunit 2 [Myotis davidii]|uniref:Transcription initiation factor IIA gamma chain n=1 Tax=Myotis davidii TaxID=225400 RepID=L5M896_MYODS|nr:Transcription initiation factor IIA subunit 2 [Myotis davidii]